MLLGTAMDSVTLATMILFTTRGLVPGVHLGSETSILQNIAYTVFMRHHLVTFRQEGQGT